MNSRLLRPLIIFSLCFAGFFPVKASARTVVVVQNRPYHYHGRYYRYHYGHHYYNNRTWVVVSGPRRHGYYRYW